jgi:hypothetical protein
MTSKKVEKKPVHGFGKYKLTIDQFCSVVSDGYHNAFGDICEWGGRYYLAYRQGQWHDPFPPGDIVIMSSPSGDIFNWEKIATISTGGDDRDPHFLKLEDVLQCYWGTYYERWKGSTLTNSQYDLITCGSQTRNGTAWSSPYQIYRPNYWLWGTAQDRFEGTYGMAYHFGPDYNHSLQLIYKSKRKYALWETLATAFNSTYYYRDLSEPTLFFNDTNQLVCLARTTDCLLMGKSEYPYSEWHWVELEMILHSPAVVKYETKSGVRFFVAGRTRLDCIPNLSEPDDIALSQRLFDLRVSSKKSKKLKDKKKDDYDLLNYYDWKEMLSEDIYRTVVCELFPDADLIEHRLTLPSGMDCGYPGIFYDGAIDRLVMQYYTQHNYPGDIIGLPKPSDINVVTLEVNNASGSKH